MIKYRWLATLAAMVSVLLVGCSEGSKETPRAESFEWGGQVWSGDPLPFKVWLKDHSVGFEKWVERHPSAAKRVYKVVRGHESGETCAYLPESDKTGVIDGEVICRNLDGPRTASNGNVNVANIWVVASGGNNATAARSGTQVTNPGGGGAFTTFAAAYLASQKGDLIGVGCGSYQRQVITQRSSPVEAAPAVVFAPARPGCVVIDPTVTHDLTGKSSAADLSSFFGSAVVFGNTGNNASPFSPSYLTLYGLDIRGTVLENGTAQAGRLSLVRNHIWDVNNQINGMVQCCGRTGTILNNEIGPTCCANDLINIGAHNYNGIAGNATNGSGVVTGLNSGYVTIMTVGDKITGVGIPLATTILSKDSATQITMSANFTGTTGAISGGVAFQEAASRSVATRITGNYLHDNTVNCTGNPSSACNNSVSLCDFNFNTGCNHPDAIQITDADALTITSNLIEGAGCQGIFTGTGNSSLDSYTGTWLVANNQINMMTQCNGSQKAIAFTGGNCDVDGSLSLNYATDPPRACMNGDFRFLYNTIYQSQGIAMGGQAPYAWQEFSNASTVVLVGNVIVGTTFALYSSAGGSGTSAANGCKLGRQSGVEFSPTFSKNRVGTGATPCGSDTAGDASLVNTGTTMLANLSNQAAAGASNALVNSDLASTPQTGITNSGEATYCGPGNLVKKDVHGAIRPTGTSCDLGADEIP